MQHPSCRTGDLCAKASCASSPAYLIYSQQKHPPQDVEDAHIYPIHKSRTNPIWPNEFSLNPKQSDGSVVNCNLKWHLFTNNLLTNVQFGFCHEHISSRSHHSLGPNMGQRLIPECTVLEIKRVYTKWSIKVSWWTQWASTGRQSNGCCHTLH